MKKVILKGFSLVEVMIAMGIVTGIGLVTTSIINQSQKSSNSVIQNTEASNLVGEFTSFLSDCRFSPNGHHFILTCGHHLKNFIS